MFKYFMAILTAVVMLTSVQAFAQKKASDTGYGTQNYLINGGCIFLQRGARTSDPGGTLVYGGPDRWSTAAANVTTFYSFTQRADYLRSGALSPYACTFDLVSQSNTVVNAEQRIEAVDARRLSGRTVTLSTWVSHKYWTTPASVSFEMLLYTPGSTDTWTSESQLATSGDMTIAGTTGGGATVWTKKTWTYTIAAGVADNGLAVRIRFKNPTVAAQEHLFQFTEVMLNTGDRAAPFALAGGDIQGEWAKVLRYAQVITTGSMLVNVGLGSLYSGTSYSIYIPLSVRPRLASANGKVLSGGWCYFGAGGNIRSQTADLSTSAGYVTGISLLQNLSSATYASGYFCIEVNSSILFDFEL